MGAGNELPGFVGLNESLFGGKGSQSTNPFTGAKINFPGGQSLIPNGEELTNSMMDRIRNGLPKELQDLFLKQGKSQISSNLEYGKQKLNESIAGSGSGIPVDALIKGQSDLQAGANESISGLNDQLLQRNENAKGDAYSRLLQLFGLAGNQASSRNEYNLDKYQIDEQSRFKWGDFLGSLIGAGGNAYGGYLSNRNGHN